VLQHEFCVINQNNQGAKVGKVYLIGTITITNPEGYKAYATEAPKTVAAAGGRYLVRGGASTLLEGKKLGERHVVVEFPSREAAEGWYNSAAYQAILPHRKNNSAGTLEFVEGFEAA
jgi:uncharacterized protein (DUF1330 family)